MTTTLTGKFKIFKRNETFYAILSESFKLRLQSRWNSIKIQEMTILWLRVFSLKPEAKFILPNIWFSITVEFVVKFLWAVTTRNKMKISIVRVSIKHDFRFLQIFFSSKWLLCYVCAANLEKGKKNLLSFVEWTNLFLHLKSPTSQKAQNWQENWFETQSSLNFL